MYKIDLSEIVGGTESISNIPNELYLAQNYPNPFNPTTTIQYSVTSSTVILSGAKNLQDFSSQSSDKNGAPQNDNSHVSLKVYDVLGREIKTLVDQQQDPGNYKINFNGSDLASGIYYYKLQFDDNIQVKKMMLLK
jgi:hypothetical protein